ncbi:MAG: hypothetical protein V1706_09900 [Pseudomonadota bacterium]
MQLKHIVFICVFFLFVAGCEKERVYENIYEGMKKREQIVNPSDEPIPEQQPSFDEYQRAREDALKEDDEKQ